MRHPSFFHSAATDYSHQKTNSLSQVQVVDKYAQCVMMYICSLGLLPTLKYPEVAPMPKRSELAALTPRITKSLYKRTLKFLRNKQGFYGATNEAIKAELLSTDNPSLKDYIQEEKGRIIHFLGTILIRRHPGLIV